jgi:hypothetical protein
MVRDGRVVEMEEPKLGIEAIERIMLKGNALQIARCG